MENKHLHHSNTYVASDENFTRVINDFNLFKADLSKGLFTITERLTNLEATTTKIETHLLEYEPKSTSIIETALHFLEGRIQTLEQQVKTLQADLTMWIEDSELQVEEAESNPEDYADARKEARE